MKPPPSDYFADAVRMCYGRAEKKAPVTPAQIWTEMVIFAMPIFGEWQRLFEWDTRGGCRNRIGTIRAVIKDGQVPGLRLDKDAKGRPIVVKTT